MEKILFFNGKFHRHTCGRKSSCGVDGCNHTILKGEPCYFGELDLPGPGYRCGGVLVCLDCHDKMVQIFP